jgi:hypothetical protein
MVRTADLRWKFLQQLDGEDTPILVNTETLRNMAFDARDMEEPFALWEESLTQDWRFRIIHDSNGDVRHEYPQGPRVATVWNRWRAARLVVAGIRFKCYTVLRSKFPAKPCMPDLIDSCRKLLDELSVDMYRSVPCFYGDESVAAPEHVLYAADDMVPRVGRKLNPAMASLLAWPVMVAVSTQGVPEGQRKQLSTVLQDVARTMGDGFLDSVAKEGKYRF